MKKFKRVFAVFFCLLLAAGILSGCGKAASSSSPTPSASQSDDKPLKIVTTIFPEYDWVREILGEKLERYESKGMTGRKLKAMIVGIPNVGKSSILNLIAKSDVLAENRLFATLDPTARKVKLGNIEVVFFDTVGFIRDIPTDLIEAFKSTLSCVKNADLILNVCDLTSDFISQTEVTEKILKDINATSPVIKVYNKCDNISDFTFCDKNGIVVSAKTGEGIENLKKAVEKFFEDYFTDLVFEIKYTDQSEIFKLKKYTEKFETEYFDDHIKVNIRIKKINLSKFAMFLK